MTLKSGAIDSLSLLVFLIGDIKFTSHVWIFFFATEPCENIILCMRLIHEQQFSSCSFEIIWSIRVKLQFVIFAHLIMVNLMIHTHDWPDCGRRRWPRDKGLSTGIRFYFQCARFARFHKSKRFCNSENRPSLCTPRYLLSIHVLHSRVCWLSLVYRGIVKDFELGHISVFGVVKSYHHPHQQKGTISLKAIPNVVNWSVSSDCWPYSRRILSLDLKTLPSSNRNSEWLTKSKRHTMMQFCHVRRRKKQSQKKRTKS